MISLKKNHAVPCKKSLVQLPVYIVTGFLDAGKTTFLNNLLDQGYWRDSRILVIQFETGEEEFQGRHDVLKFPKRILEQHPEQIIDQIRDFILDHTIDEIWIEWNGVVLFSQLQVLLLHPSLTSLCEINKVIHIADAKMLENLLGKTGGALPEQIANCDFAVIRNVTSVKDFNRIWRILRSINPDINVYAPKSYADLSKPLSRPKPQPLGMFFLLAISFVMLYFAAWPLLEPLKIPVGAIVNVFLGIILKAFPFLIIGVLLSSAIQVFIGEEAVISRFPKSFWAGMPAAVLGGFLFPVCYSAYSPFLRSLIKKGIPLPVAVTFMTVSPIINPVVILSTWYAFNANLGVLIGRITLGIIASILIGLIFAIRESKNKVLSGVMFDRLICNCGCYEDMESITTFKGKIGSFLHQSKTEFFGAGKYLVVGAFISSLFNVMGPGIFSTSHNGINLAVSIIVMMTTAFILSLCSSSDAFVARGFADQFPMGAIMGFLIFGPMMNLKNVMMLASGFSKHFIIKLAFIIFAVCFIVVLSVSLGGMQGCR